MVAAFLPAVLAVAQTIAAGKIIEDVRCEKDPAQGYALYLPSRYSTEHAWPTLIAFDPRARGLTAVERFAPAAEKYGWIIVGSNNSRNGSGQSSVDSLRAIGADIARYAVDPKRMYAGGMSGGARIAMEFALETKAFAGVIAASAGFPDSKVRKTVPFPVFGTAGTDDFNWREMYELDQTLTSPHRIVVFEGSHVWLSTELATEAIEWLELQAMRAGIRPKDRALIAALFADRTTKASTLRGKSAWEATRNIGLDFEGLNDEAASFTARAKTMQREKLVQEALKRERNEFAREKQLVEDIWRNEQGLADPEKPSANIAELRDRLAGLVKQANSDTDSSDRRIARRVTRNIAASGALDSHRNPEYQKLLQKLGLTGRPR